MTKAEKIRKIQGILELKDSRGDLYVDLLKTMGDLKTNYGDYMITEPIDCDEELERISGADYELCTALLTMLLREDHFSNGSFDRRFADGQVLPVLVRMKAHRLFATREEAEKSIEKAWPHCMMLVYRR